MPDVAKSIRSNLSIWKELQRREYFGTDATIYSGTNNEIRVPDDELVERFLPLTASTVMAIIGCGYGREATIFGKRVGIVYGIDVSHQVLKKTIAYTRERGVNNLHPVLAENYDETIPGGLDLVYSIVVMQHLTRDLVKDYFLNLGKKLKRGGSMVVQFYESPQAPPENDAGDDIIEPSVSWSIPQLNELCIASGLENVEISTMTLAPEILWHFVHFRKPR
jgi:SAM-dependent methyltransferase